MKQKLKITEEDIALTKLIDKAGTNKTKHKNDIIYLYKKYVDSTTPLCKTCSMEIALAYIRYKQYYEIYKG